ncbi:hypothetical protein ANOM_005738 [Aspergillus nomiae NRRL 13137]|uniref:CobQ/CobB/MinD/ParA nucleotide binding domain-containing protein n=1 Tax=Aspergillus nomiae NRRL (strain ATCC 15546 / NRRL 13137 / CBS 260.88 / M93) TaxID=1509407 RepID=A0A0L1J2U4_ASPN3|nr:uncharacterized protein ANOM_005738 [Aspergillus nomiae NRRL 13137]KNG85753.1 hypothetical protein ANOM_005738 [Aspergillus nomiae NRRL 13137]
MHITSNIRNLEKFLTAFPWADSQQLTEADLIENVSTLPDTRAHLWDLVAAKVVAVGDTVTEDREGHERPLVLNELLIAPLVGRESSLGHSSVLPTEGVVVGSTIDYVSTGGGLGISPDNPPGKGDPSKVRIIGLLCYTDGQVAKAQDFAKDLPCTDTLKPVIVVVGSKSDAGKTTVCIDLLKGLAAEGRQVGVAKASGTAQRKEIEELAVHANEGLDTADAGMPTTYPPSQESDKWAECTHRKSLLALESNLRALSVANEVIVVEFGGDLLSASVPEILEDPGRLNIVAVIMVAESATAAIGMETKLLRISPSYASIPYYVAGPTATLRANRNRVERETQCAGCYDLWTKTNSHASQSQRDASTASSQKLTRKVLEHCRLGSV